MKNLEKQKLLITSMCDLPLGTFFSNIFKGSVFSLQSFINHNNFVKKEEDLFEFVLYGNPQAAFKKKSKKWKMLKSFLLEKGFTYEDWPMLIPKVKVSGKTVDDFSKLNKEQILHLPIKLVCPGKTTYDWSDSILVETALQYVSSDFRVRESVFVIQKKLRLLGFTEDDGAIMKLQNPKAMTKEDYIKKLEQKGYSRETAIELVEVMLEYHWILED